MRARACGLGCFYGFYLASTLSHSCFGSSQPAVPISPLTDCMLLIIYTANPLQSKLRQLYFRVNSLTSKELICVEYRFEEIYFGAKKKK